MIQPDLYRSTFEFKNLSFKSLGAGVGGTRYWSSMFDIKVSKAVEAELVHGSPSTLSSALSPETNDCDMFSSNLGISFFSFDFPALEPRASCPSGEN